MKIKPLLPWLLLIVLGLALLVETVLFTMDRNRYAAYVTNAAMHSLVPTYSNNYSVNDGVYVPQNEDPQIGYLMKPVRLKSIQILFSEPLADETVIQVYYAEADEDLSESCSVMTKAQSGAESVIVDLPDGIYTHLRVDINGSFALSGVQIFGADPVMKTGVADMLRLEMHYGLRILTVAFCWFFFLRGTDKKTLKSPLTAQENMYLLCCFILCFLWSCVFLDYYYAPDEDMRYDILYFIASTGTLPHGGEPSLVSSYGFSYGFGLTLPYIAGAFFMKIASLFFQPEFPLIIAARFTSVLSYTGIVYFAIRIGSKVFSEQVKWVFIFFLSLTPQIVFLGTYFNLDIFALFTVMMILDSWIECLTKNWNRRSCVKLGVAMGLCFLSYHFAYSYMIGSFLLYCFWYAKNHKTIPFSRFIQNGFLILGVVFLVSGWYFIRNAILYDGDLFGFRTRQNYGEMYAVPELKPSLHWTYKKEGYSILGMLQNSTWIEWTLKSMVSYLGHMRYQAPSWVYIGYGIVFFLGGGYGLYLLLPRNRKDISSGRMSLLVSALAACIVTVMLSLYYSWAIDFQPQGRYVIYVLPPAALAVAYGYERLTEKTGKSPEQIVFIQRIVAGVIAVFLVFTLLDAFFRCVEIFLADTFWR